MPQYRTETFDKTYVIGRQLLVRILWTRLEATAKWTWPTSVDRLCDAEESPSSSFSVLMHMCVVILLVVVCTHILEHRKHSKQQS